MNPAPAHLEAKLRPIFDFTVGQIAALFCGALLGLVWAKFLCPVHGWVAAISGAYLAAIPAMPVFFASQTDFDLWLLVRGALAWRRREGRYVPGPGARCLGYLTEAPDTAGDLDADLELDLDAIWENP